MKTHSFSKNLNQLLLIIKMNASVVWARKSLWVSLFLFALTLLILFPFAFGTELIKRFDVQMGSYWIIQEFMCVMVILNMFKIEENGRLIDVYLSTQNSRLILFFGKVIFTAIQIIVLALPVALIWIILFHIDISSIWRIIGTFFLSHVLFALTSALIGGFLYAITSKNQIKEILQPLLFFPLQSASLLASVNVCLAGLEEKIVLNSSGWWSVLWIYTVLFIGLSLLFGEVLFEES